MFIFNKRLRVFANLLQTVLVLLLLQMVALSAAALTCDVSVLPSGHFLFQLSSAVELNCNPSWEDANKTVIARGSEMNQSLVQDLTDRTLTLYQCLDHARFTAYCTSYLEANCSFNCSSVLAPTTRPVTAHPQNLHQSVIPGSAVFVLVALLVLGFLAWRYLVPKCKGKKQEYSPGRAAPPGVEMAEFAPTQVTVA